MANDVQEIWKAIEGLKHALSNTLRYGRVQKNEKGETQALIGTNPDGKAVFAAIGRVAQHSGFVSDNTPMAEGQAVAILALDPDGVQTITIPIGDNDFHPKGGNVGDDKVTRRIRRPPEKKKDEGQQQGGGAPGSLSDGAAEPKDPPKMQDDDENDWIEEQGYKTKKFRKGKLTHEFGVDDNGKEFSKTTIDKVTHHATADGYTLEVDGTKFEFTKAGFKQTGGKQTHDGLNVGAGHIHGGVLKGGDKTAVPEPDA